MKVNYVKLTAGVLTGFMALSSVPYAVYAAGPTAGVASYTSDIVSTSNTLTAGVTSMLTDVMLKGDETSETATDVATTDAEPVKSAYADTAVAQVSDSVNIRASADENSESLGKLYNNGIGTVLETTDNGWYKIQSGSVTGYVKGDYVVVGDDALVQSAGRRVATVNTETLKVRTTASTDAEVLGLVSGEEDLPVVDESTAGWVGVSTADGTGYVSTDYVTLDTEFTYAESKEEEAARKAEEARMQAEKEVKRQIEEAKYQAEVARQAEETSMKAEAARVEAERWRQKVTAEAKDYEQTAVLTAQDMYSYQGNSDDSERLKAEEMFRNAEEERIRAEKVSSQYADEIRRAREQEMHAEEARMQAEFAARKNAEEAKRQAGLAKLKAEEAKRLSEQPDEEPPTTLFSNRTLVTGSKPTLTRKTTGESVQINKQVFCIGKADQGVDYKVTGNKSISRRHAYITSINGTHYLRDNNSTNHTFLNGTQVYSNVDVAIPDNSVIRLSNEEFIFKINS